MRKDLRNIGSQDRYIYTGTFERFGIKNGYKGPITTVLLLNVCDKDGNVVTDHLWFNKTKGFAKVDLQQGDRVSFEARVDSYVKGYQGYREDVYSDISIDYKLSYPTKIQKIA